MKKSMVQALKKREHLKNVAGIMIGFALIIASLFFTIWQLDIILTGCVWWEASPTGMGWAWYGPGAYAKAPFQCFLWRTTIGQAYDTLFFLNFALPIIGAIIIFLSVWTWEE